MDHVQLYERLVWNELSSGSVLAANGSVDVEGVMRGFVKDGRVVLLFDEQRVAELVAQNRGAVYTANNRPGWLTVDPGVDEATFRELFHEAVGAEARASLLAQFNGAVCRNLLDIPDLSEPDWDTFAMVIEASADSIAMAAYRYTDLGPPVPTALPADDHLYRQLHDRIRNVQGEAWDTAVVKLHRIWTRLVMSFAYGPSADQWRLNPANLDRLPEALRPVPEDFPGVPFVTAPVHLNEDVNLAIGERTKTVPPAAAWPEVSRRRHATWAGVAVNGAFGLLMRAHGTDPETREITYEAIGLVQLSGVDRRADGGYQAQVEWIPVPPAEDLEGVVDRAELRQLLRRASDRDPTFVTGWRRAGMPAPTQVEDLAYSAVAEDLLRRLAMPLSKRIELVSRPERERFQALIHQLREIAVGTPPPPQAAQRLDRPLIVLPPEGIPVLANNIWLTPGGVSTITASPFIADKAFDAGWLAFTADLTVGRVAMATRPLRRSDTVNDSGFYSLTTDQIRPAIIRAVIPGEAGRSLVELIPAPSAEEAAGRGLPGPDEERRRLSTYVELLRRAHARDPHVMGTATGTAYRLWEAGRFTSLRALMSWQIGQLGFDAQTVLDLQAIAWPDRFSALTLVLQAVADGRPLGEARTAAAEVAGAALHGDR